MPKRILEGNVVSTKMDKTVTILVERRYLHPVYKKYIKRTTKYSAHDEGNLCKENERVQIQECAPLSKRKTWKVISGEAGTANKAYFDAVAPVVEKAPAKAKSADKAPAKKTTAKKAAAKKDK